MSNTSLFVPGTNEKNLRRPSSSREARKRSNPAFSFPKLFNPRLLVVLVVRFSVCRYLLLVCRFDCVGSTVGILSSTSLFTGICHHIIFAPHGRCPPPSHTLISHSPCYTLHVTFTQSPIHSIPFHIINFIYSSTRSLLATVVWVGTLDIYIMEERQDHHADLHGHDWENTLPSTLQDHPAIRAFLATHASFIITDPRLPGNPIIFASPGFLMLTGYSIDRVLGRNCRFLQGPETDPAAVAQIREAVDSGRDVAVTLLNYKSDGSTFWNQVLISGVRKAHLLHQQGNEPSATSLLYFIGLQQPTRCPSRGSSEEGDTA